MDARGGVLMPLGGDLLQINIDVCLFCDQLIRLIDK